jgi:hypothetical protein
MSEVDVIYTELAKVKEELGAITKGSDNPFFKSKYADLNTHLEAVEPLLHKNGMILLQPIQIIDGVNTVSSIIIHAKSGQKVSSSMKLIGENDMQKAGSAVTYARRYTLGALLSMRAEDDDGESAVGRTSSKSKSTKKASFPRSTNKNTSGDDI